MNVQGAGESDFSAVKVFREEALIRSAIIKRSQLYTCGGAVVFKCAAEQCTGSERAWGVNGTPSASGGASRNVRHVSV